MVILTLCDYYLPGFKAGGPIRSVNGVATLLAPEFKFKIVTRDHDRGDKQTYPGIERRLWCDLGGHEAYYVAKGRQGILQLYRVLAAGEYDVLYLNSLFSPKFSILPLMWRKLGMLPNKPVVLAPRGECSRGALRLKRWKKRSFLTIARAFRLYSGVVWQASSIREKVDIHLALQGNFDVQMAPILVAPDLPLNQSQSTDETTIRAEQRPGNLRVVFLSRISPMKNLEQALQLLRNLTGKIEFDIIGPAEDALYWQRCQRLIAELPANVHVRYLGVAAPGDVPRILQSYDLFLLPTLGENYGHVIFEALAAGCQVLISDRTPWNDLEKAGVGWAIPLHETERFEAALQQAINMDGKMHSQVRHAARDYAIAHQNSGKNLQLNRELFRSAAGKLPKAA
jgi:glycosyltransferase involved in cell wall biosynthesis